MIINMEVTIRDRLVSRIKIRLLSPIRTQTTAKRTHYFPVQASLITAYKPTIAAPIYATIKAMKRYGLEGKTFMKLL